MRTTFRARSLVATTAILLPAIFAPAGSVRAATTACTRFDIESLTVGSPIGYVRARFGRESMTTNLARAGRHDTTAVDYVIRGRSIYVEYDHRIDKKPEAKIAVLRVSLPSTEDALQETVRHFGTPTVSPERRPDEDGQLPPPDGFVWVDPSCKMVATVYRRAGSWWSGDVGTFLQLESIDTVRQGTSAALPYLEGTAALAAILPTALATAQANDGASAGKNPSAPPPSTDVATKSESAPLPSPVGHAATELTPQPPVGESLAAAAGAKRASEVAAVPPPAEHLMPAPVGATPGVRAQETVPPAPAAESLKTEQRAIAVPPPTQLAAPEPPAQAPAGRFSPIADTLPLRIAAPPPTYPANLRLMGVTGHVSLAAVVRIDGTVGDVRVVKSDPSGRGFEQAAIAAVKRWRYKPATLRSVPIETEVEVAIEFK